MEERLDDAINVLRNHCEPQLPLGIPNMEEAPYVGSSNIIGAHSLPENCGGAEGNAVKIERLPVPISNSSSFYMFLFNNWTKRNLSQILLLEKRKDLDPDAKPSSSVEGTNKAPGKRQRR